MHDPNRSRVETAVLIAALVVAASWSLYQIISQRWMADDAFISFRYARNLVAGHGLVFNTGERVEGYTNFLWTMLIAASMKVGFEPVVASWVLSISFYLGTVISFATASWRVFRKGGSRLFLPLGALCLLIQHESQVYATSGMETAAVTFFVSIAFVTLLTRRSDRALLATGIALALAALTRPDALIFAASATVYVALSSRFNIKRILLLVAPLLLVYLPYWLWRYDYYGYVFPNTYYAKSGGSAYYNQGLTYIWIYIRAYYVLGLFPVAALWLFRADTWHDEDPGAPNARWHALLIALFTLPYLFYVARVGGDFMFGRFLIPITGILFFAIESALARIAMRRLLRYGLAILIIGATFFRYDLFAVSKISHGIANEPAFYPLSWTEYARDTGARMAIAFEGQDVRVAFYGSYAVWAYYANPATAIESGTGLTDTLLAHREIARRGRPGHEKPAPIEYLQQRGVHLLFRGRLLKETTPDSLRLIYFGPRELSLLTYDSELMDHLDQFDDIWFTRYPDFLDELRPVLKSLSKPEAESIYEFSKEYYFDHSPDTARSSWMRNIIETLPATR